MISSLLSSCNIGKAISGKDCDKKLINGIIVGNIEMINEALEEGANINKLSGINSGTRPIIIAIDQINNERIVKYLIIRGADVNYINKGTTPLKSYANNSDINFCKLLIEYGAKINYADSNYTALEAVVNHNARSTDEKIINQIITLLLEHGAKFKPATLKYSFEHFEEETFEYSIKKRILEGLLKAGYKSGLDPALEAAMIVDSNKLDLLIKNNKVSKEDAKQIAFFTSAFGKPHTLMLVLDKGLDLKTVDKHKNTLLMLASNYGNLEMVKFLIEKKADIEIANENQDTPLQAAVNNDKYEVAEYLINKGAKNKNNLLELASSNGNIKLMKLIITHAKNINNQYRNDALSQAITNNRIEASNYLIDIGADINNSTNGNTFLSNESILGNISAVKYLVEHGAKVNGINAMDTPLIETATFDNFEVMKYLITNGANVNRVADFGNEKGPSALSEAIRIGNFDMVKLLVKNGANIEYPIELKGGERNTPVIAAAFCGSKHILEYIIKKGANVNYKNQNGQTALMVAATQGLLDNVKILINNKADKNLKDNNGNTAMDLAKKNIKAIDVTKHKEVFDFLSKL